MAIPRFPQGPFSVTTNPKDQGYALEPPYPAVPPTSGAQLGTAIPIVESGTGAAGTAITGSHEDHVHPAAAAVNPGVVGDIVAETLPSAAAAGATGKYADAGHRHAIAAAGAPAAEALGSAQVTGAVGTFSDSGHIHAMPAKSVAVPLANSGAGAAGASNNPSLDDHVHPASTAIGHDGGSLGIDTAASSAAFVDMISLNLGIGTWILNANITVDAALGPAGFGAKIWDGVTELGGVAGTVVTPGLQVNGAITTVPFVLAAPTTIKLSVKATGNTVTVKSAAFGVGHTTAMSAIQVG